MTSLIESQINTSEFSQDVFFEKSKEYHLLKEQGWTNSKLVEYFVGLNMYPIMVPQKNNVLSNISPPLITEEQFQKELDSLNVENADDVNTFIASLVERLTKEDSPRDFAFSRDFGKHCLRLFMDFAREHELLTILSPRIFRTLFVNESLDFKEFANSRGNFFLRPIHNALKSLIDPEIGGEMLLFLVSACREYTGSNVNLSFE